MTEAEWLAATHPTPMLGHIGGTFLDENASNRKLRLFTYACCHRIWHLLDERSRNAVEVAEKYVDGSISDDELNIAMSGADHASRDFERESPEFNEPLYFAANCASWAAYYTDFPEWGSREARSAAIWEKVHQGVDRHLARTIEAAQQSALILDIFGNPFRPVVADSCWLHSKVVALAESIYQNRAFDRMPILTDALHDVGCDNIDILTHCRSDASHTRGCWVVDLLTGRK